MESWTALFDRAASFERTADDAREALDARREGDDDESADAGRTADVPDPEDVERSPARVVADADVLAADLFGDDDSREALDALRRHSWTTLVASDPLLDDAQAVVESLGDESLAADWRERVEQGREPVSHPADDHPALGSAYRGGAMHVLSFDDRLLSSKAGATLGGQFPVSVHHPRAFATLFDAESLHEEVVGGDYPGPDRDPRE
ncbi:DUF7384 family protein [Halopelagius fulvigenes]|uniref:PIN domain-containing protein n=1 Tax=Halopelagius fulvigenes TaxID=1198324 RepID=A0ABD5TUS5_9EURY